jgi:hypothetical protein
MYRLFFLITFYLLSNIIHTQTIIIPIVGLDFTEMKTRQTNQNIYNYEITNRGFTLRSPLLGIEISQSMTQRFWVRVGAYYTKKRAKASVFSAIPYDGIRYNYFRNNLSILYKPVNTLSIGVGYDYSTIRNIKHTYEGRTYTEFIQSFIEHGPSLSIVYRLKKFEVSSILHIGTNSNSDKSGFNIHPVNYFGVNLGYELLMWRPKAKRGSDCPDFNK